MRRAILVAALTATAPEVLADEAWTPHHSLPPTGQIDGWYGPFADSVRGEDSPRGTGYQVHDTLTEDDDGNPTPVAAVVTWDDGDGEGTDDGAEGDAWGIAVETPDGWFVSPRLGTRANRVDCDVRSVKAIGDRVGIEYTCYQGRFDGAQRDFFLY